MDKLVKYCGFLPGAFFLLLIIFMAMIGGIDYLMKVPALMYINIACLFIAPFFVSNPRHRAIGYIAVGVSAITYLYQGIMEDSSHLLLYIAISIGLIIYFIGYDYLLRKSTKI